MGHPKAYRVNSIGFGASLRQHGLSSRLRLPDEIVFRLAVKVVPVDARCVFDQLEGVLVCRCAAVRCLHDHVTAQVNSTRRLRILQHNVDTSRSD